jgi:hypothetical protein
LPVSSFSSAGSVMLGSVVLAQSIFGMSVDRPTIALLAFLNGKATPNKSPPTTVLPKMLYS